MTSIGSLLTVTTREEYESLLVLSTSIKGWFDPTANNGRGYGEVWFASPSAAQEARRTVL